MKRNRILDIIYPRRCPMCDGILLPEEPWICEKCVEKLHPITENRCVICGKPVPEQEERCRDCQKREHYFDRARAPYGYHGQMEQSLMRFKYGGRMEYAGFYAHAICRYEIDFIRQIRPEVLIPVPVHPARMRKRGYNQAHLIAKHLSQELQIAEEIHLVKRVRNTKAQKDLNPEERRKNLEHAFALTGKEQPYRTILLVDDIYTTGSTADALAKLLKQHGARQVSIVSAAVVK